MVATVGGSTPDKELTKADILTCDDTQIDKVRVPEWGGFVHVRGLSGTERDRFEESQTKTDRKGQRSVRFENFRAKLCSLCICDSKGERMFLPSDVHALGKKNAAALARVFAKATELSGMSEDDVEDMVGNSESDPNEDSGSD